MTENEKLIKALIDAAYDTGYCSGKGEDGQPHHTAAIAKRQAIKQRLLRRVAMRDLAQVHFDRHGGVLD